MWKSVLCPPQYTSPWDENANRLIHPELWLSSVFYFFFIVISSDLLDYLHDAVMLYTWIMTVSRHLHSRAKSCVSWGAEEDGGSDCAVMFLYPCVLGPILLMSSLYEMSGAKAPARYLLLWQLKLILYQSDWMCGLAITTWEKKIRSFKS